MGSSVREFSVRVSMTLDSLRTFSESFLKMQPSFREKLAEKKCSILHRTKQSNGWDDSVHTFSVSKCLFNASRCFALVRSAICTISRRVVTMRLVRRCVVNSTELCTSGVLVVIKEES